MFHSVVAWNDDDSLLNTTMIYRVLMRYPDKLLIIPIRYGGIRNNLTNDGCMKKSYLN